MAEEAVLGAVPSAGAAASAQFLVTPTAFDFGDVAVGSRSPEQHATVTNVGTSPVVVSATGGAAGVFGGGSNCQGRTLNPGESCRISYAFTPSSAGPATDSTSGTFNGQPFSFRFRGNGT